VEKIIPVLPGVVQTGSAEDFQQEIGFDLGLRVS